MRFATDYQDKIRHDHGSSTYLHNEMSVPSFVEFFLHRVETSCNQLSFSVQISRLERIDEINYNVSVL